MSSQWIDFGLQPWEIVLQTQLELVERVRQHPEERYILVGEHLPIYTAGRAYREPLPDAINGIPIATASRGGLLTYHGPGQLVLYPIIRLSQPGGISALLSLLSQWVSEALLTAGIQSVSCSASTLALESAKGHSGDLSRTGIWIAGPNEKALKLVSIGLAVKHWVSYHGIAINVCNELAPFHWIEPCGYPGETMTSTLLQQLHQPVAKPITLAGFKQNLYRTCPWL